MARTVLATALWGTLLLLLGYYFHRKTGFEKVLTSLVMPFQLFWLTLTGWVTQLFIARPKQAFVPLMGWGILSACSCGPISGLATNYLESRFLPPELSVQSPLDAVVVLGGGVNENKHRPQFGQAGDRALLGAELYHGGFTRKLITTGSSIAGLDGRDRTDPSTSTRVIWEKLDIPRDDIITMSGQNTYSEIQSLSEALEDEMKGWRIGLVTSALHLPRAMRLAEARGIAEHLTPIPADYRYREPNQRTLMDYIPSAGSLAQLSYAQHEYMAKLVNR